MFVIFTSPIPIFSHFHIDDQIIDRVVSKSKHEDYCLSNKMNGFLVSGSSGHGVTIAFKSIANQLLGQSQIQSEEVMEIFRNKLNEEGRHKGKKDLIEMREMRNKCLIQ